jgi:hypothetical protein
MDELSGNASSVNQKDERQFPHDGLCPDPERATMLLQRSGGAYRKRCDDDAGRPSRPPDRFNRSPAGLASVPRGLCGETVDDACQAEALK